MADETAVVPNVDVTETQVTPEEPVIAKPDEGGEVTDPQGTEPEGETEHERKRKGGWQRKIERLETEREFLMQELLKTRNSQPEPKPEPAPSVKDPTPQDFDLGDGSYDIVKFNKAHVDWLWDQKQAQSESKRKEAEAKAEHAKAQESYETRQETLRAKHDDYDEVADKTMAALHSLKNTPSSAFVANAILKHEHGNELEYFFGNNPAELKRISNLPPEMALVEVGTLIAQFAHSESAQPDKPKEAVVAPVTRAPKPATPANKPAAEAKPVDPRLPESDKMSPDEWLKARRAQLKRK